MERDELLRGTAKRYAEAQLKVELADREAGRTKMEADNARLERDRIEEELRKFVGRNHPRRVVLVENANRAVLIDMDLRDSVNERVFVTLEKTL